VNNLVEALNAVLPSVLWRHRWPEYQDKYGIPLARGTMQNRDSEGRGPRAGKMSGRVYYCKKDYLAWLSYQTESSCGDSATP